MIIMENESKNTFIELEKERSLKSTVLIVEDDEHFALYCQVLLKNMGYRCVVANSGARALEVLADNLCFSLVIIDINLPDIDGYEVAKK